MELPAKREMVWAEDIAHLMQKMLQWERVCKITPSWMVVLLLQRFISFKKGLPENEEALGKEMLSPPFSC